MTAGLVCLFVSPPGQRAKALAREGGRKHSPRCGHAAVPSPLLHPAVMWACTRSWHVSQAAGSGTQTMQSAMWGPA